MSYTDEYDDWISVQYEQDQRRDQRELLATKTTESEDAKALREVEAMAASAQEKFDAGTYHARCIDGEAVFYYSYPKALVPGHIYSDDGRAEFKISRACEYHFDEWFKDDEYDNPPGEVPF